MKLLLTTLIFTLMAGATALAGETQCVPAAAKHKIILFGEIHDQPAFNAELDLHKRKSKEGKEVFAEEGRFFSPIANATQVGFDAPFPYGLNILLSLNIKFEEALKTDDESMFNWKFLLVNNTLRNKFLQEAWDGLKKSRPFSDIHEEKFAEVLDQLFKDPDNAGEWLKVKAASHEMNAAFLALIKDFGRSYVRMAKTSKYRKPMHVPANVNLALDSLDGKNQNEAIIELAVKWRDQELSRNIMSLYYEAQAQNKDLFVEVGALHVYDLQERIARLSHNKVKTEIQGLDIVAKFNPAIAGPSKL